MEFLIDPQVQAIQSAGSIMVATAIAASIALLPAFAAGIGQGLATAKAAEAVGKNPEARGEVTLTLIVGCAITETSGIYGLLIAFLILFANPFFNMFMAFVG